MIVTMNSPLQLTRPSLAQHETAERERHLRREPQVSTASTIERMTTAVDAPCARHRPPTATATTMSARIGRLMTLASSVAPATRAGDARTRRIAGIELVVEAADEGADEEAERERGSCDDGHRLRRIGADVVQACRSKEDADEHRDQENEPMTRRLWYRVAAERAEKQIESQSENVCNHSRPSTSVSRRRAREALLERRPRAPRRRCRCEHLTATITATPSQTRSTRSMPWLERTTVPPCDIRGEDVEDDRRRHRVDGLERLVEHEQPRRVDHGARQHELLRHPGRVVRDLAAEGVREVEGTREVGGARLDDR
jgi:hypothetical protein